MAPAIVAENVRFACFVSALPRVFPLVFSCPPPVALCCPACWGVTRLCPPFGFLGWHARSPPCLFLALPPGGLGVCASVSVFSRSAGFLPGLGGGLAVLADPGLTLGPFTPPGARSLSTPLHSR